MRNPPRRLGLLGGITWHSSLDYERRLNEGVNAALGGSASADLVVRSYNFQHVAELQAANAWDRLAAEFTADALSLQRAGAEAILICANTMHMVAAQVQAGIDVPIINLLDATADAILASGTTTVALLGTGYTMRMPFYRDHMASRGITTLTPSEPQLGEVHNLIYTKLARGIVDTEGRRLIHHAAAELIAQGAQCVIAGCTEIPLVMSQEDLKVPFYDSVELHVEAALRFALAPHGDER